MEKMLRKGVRDTVLIDVRTPSKKVNWEKVLDVTWGVAMDEDRRMHTFVPPRYVVIHTRSRRVLRPSPRSDVARHLGEVTRCEAQLGE